MSDLQVRIEPAVFALAPRYERIVLQAIGPRNNDLSQSLSARFQAAVAHVADRFADVDIASIPHVEAWREVFRAAGYSPSKFRSSIEALLRRAVRRELEPLGIALVDAGTVATMEQLVPIGVHVMDNLGRDPLVLGPASGTETFEAFDGSIEHPDPGELVYRSGNVVLTRRWVWRQGKVGSVFGSPRLLAINIDILDPSLADGNDSVRVTTELVEACGGHVVGTIHLTSTSPSAHLETWPDPLSM
jgi:DNA/RNA-binding domain of Phe-tRNA-synthetase-like protein